MMLYTTLNKLQRHDPCAPGKEKLLAYLGKTETDDEPLALKTILESNGIRDALWCLCGVDGHDKEIRLFAIWCARQVEHFDKSGASKTLNDANEAYANGQITASAWAAPLAAARDSARTAAWTLAKASALDAARAAARDAPWVAAREAALGAALGAALKATRVATRVAVRVAVRDAQEIEFIKRFCTEEN